MILRPTYDPIIPATFDALAEENAWQGEAGGGAGAFDPLTGDSSLLYLFDARYGVTDGGDGSVESWTDRKSGVAPSQGTAAAKPTYSASDAAWNNLPSISADAGDSLAVTLGAAFATPCTMYGVIKLAVNDANVHFPWCFGTSLAFADPNTASWRAQSGGATISGGTVDTNGHKVCVVVNGASSALHIDDFATAAATGTLNADSQTLMTLFAIGGGSGGWNGSAVFYAFASGAHDAGMRAQYATWIDAQGWGLP